MAFKKLPLLNRLNRLKRGRLALASSASVGFGELGPAGEGLDVTTGGDLLPGVVVCCAEGALTFLAVGVTVVFWPEAVSTFPTGVVAVSMPAVAVGLRVSTHAEVD
jgi:hypothetical protein